METAINHSSRRYRKVKLLIGCLLSVFLMQGCYIVFEADDSSGWIPTDIEAPRTREKYLNLLSKYLLFSEEPWCREDIVREARVHFGSLIILYHWDNAPHSARSKMFADITAPENIKLLGGDMTAALAYHFTAHGWSFGTAEQVRRGKMLCNNPDASPSFRHYPPCGLESR